VPEELRSGSADGSGVWPEHVDAVAAFLLVRRQWRLLPNWGARPTWVGLDLGACEAAWRMAGIQITPELLGQIMTVEHGAIEALNEG